MGDKMDLATLFTTGTATIDLGKKLVQLYENSHQNDPSLFELLAEMRPHALKTCQRISEELSELNMNFQKWNIDTSRTLWEIQSDVDWYNFLRKMRLNNVHSRFSGIYNELYRFIDDVTYVMICNGSVGFGTVEDKSLETKQKLDSLVNANTPIRDVIQEMLNICHDLVLQLQQNR
jgi:hypothetical protein